jgi:gamma-glutamyltranspeptidase
VDAAVATAFALAVTYPQAGNLAGGGFAVGRTRNGGVFALDFRETAPAGTWERTFIHPDGSRRGDASLVGGLSVATPGTVRGLEELHRRLGRLPWARLRASPETRRIFFRGDEPVPAGELLVQPELAATLEAIASGGADAFHRGSVARLVALGASLRLDRATPSSAIQAGAVPREGDQTTHFSVATADGEAVAVTYTLNETFGNGDVVPGVGVLLNNEMDDFATQPGRPNLFGLIQGTSNAVRGGARPVSSMCPTVVLEDGRPRFVLGSPGGSTIPSAVLEVFFRAGPLGQPLPAAVAGPRFHHQHLPDELVVEKEAWPAADLEDLRRRGHVIRQRTLIGVVHAISFEKDGTLLGVADPRLYGRPVSAEQSSRP